MSELLRLLFLPIRSEKNPKDDREPDRLDTQSVSRLM